jgi:hypothetical protein
VILYGFWLREVMWGMTFQRVATATATATIGLAMTAQAMGIVPSASAEPSQLVRTESGKVRCDILRENAACQYLPGFPQAPVCDDTGPYHCDIANLTPAGAFSWSIGNIPGARPQDDAVLNYGQTYHFLGWTIQPDESGTRVTNDSSGRGMFVSVDDVHPI